MTSRAAFGVLYVIDGNPRFREMLDISIASLRQWHPDWPIEILDLPNPEVAFARRWYRRLSFWKRDRRRARAYQDMRTVEAKAAAWGRSPFERTLFLDADTVVLRSLDAMRDRAAAADVLATAMPWKRYRGFRTWQPPTFPFVMSGVVFYNRTFGDAYARVLARLGSLRGLPTGDQFAFSLTLAMEAERLRIALAPDLQFDVINADRHAAPDVPPRQNNIIDLTWEGLRRFHVFHYNDRKPDYLAAMRRDWGVSAAGGVAHAR